MATIPGRVNIDIKCYLPIILTPIPPHSSVGPARWCCGLQQGMQRL